MSNLPCHLRDDLWLAKMIKHNQKLLYISTSRILHYVKTSSFFQEKRHEYEQERNASVDKQKVLRKKVNN